MKQSFKTMLSYRVAKQDSSKNLCNYLVKKLTISNLRFFCHVLKPFIFFTRKQPLFRKKFRYPFIRENRKIAFKNTPIGLYVCSPRPQRRGRNDLFKIPHFGVNFCGGAKQNHVKCDFPKLRIFDMNYSPKILSLMVDKSICSRSLFPKKKYCRGMNY